jgi:hypothetical protein
LPPNRLILFGQANPARRWSYRTSLLGFRPSKDIALYSQAGAAIVRMALYRALGSGRHYPAVR